MKIIGAWAVAIGALALILTSCNRWRPDPPEVPPNTVVEGAPEEMSETDGGSDPTWTGATWDRIRRDGSQEIRLTPDGRRVSDVENRREVLAESVLYQQARRELWARGYRVTSEGDPEEIGDIAQPLREFQSDHGLPVTGRLDEVTIEALELPMGRMPANIPAKKANRVQ